MSTATTLPSPAPSKPWWQPCMFDYSQLEAFVMRAGFAILFYITIKWETAPYKTQRNPTGLANFFDFTWLAEHPPGPFWHWLCIAGLILYVIGYLPALGLAPTLTFAIMIGTLVTSKAMHHSWQAVTLLALAQFIVYAWPRGAKVHRIIIWLVMLALGGLAIRELRLLPSASGGAKPLFAWLGAALHVVLRYAVLASIVDFLSNELHKAKAQLADASLVRPGIGLHRIAVYSATVTFAAAYVVCGIVKLVNSSFQWIQKVPYLAVQLLKSNWDGYYDSLQPIHEWIPKITQGIVDYPNIARLVFGAGLVIELVAFVVLINRKWALVGGLSIIALHLSISKVMDLHFEYHMAAALIFLVNLPGLKKTFARSGA